MACLLAMSAVGAYYWWAVRAAGYRFQWGRDLSGYYDLLARGFASGHLYVPIDPSPELLRMPNPWDPAIDEKYKMHDMALFQGHYYLYFGAAPALLFLPWRLATAHDLPETSRYFCCVSEVFCSPQPRCCGCSTWRACVRAGRCWR